VNSGVIFDCERMKYPNTGLYHFCKELGSALLRQQPNHTKFSFYLPEQEKGVFGADQHYIFQSSHHKFWLKHNPTHHIWHSTFQGTQYLPFKTKGLKIVSTIHDLNFLHENKSSLKEEKYLLKVQKLINKSDHIVAISNFVRSQVLEYLRIDEKKISVIYNGTNKPKTLDYVKPEAVTEKPFFFSIGTILEKKNFHVLPAMLLHNDYELIIAGITQNEGYKNKIIAEAQRLGVADRVKLIGAISDSEKYWLFNHCAAFCFPSIAEGFGLPVVEAMQFGTPVILSKATSLPEIGGPHAFYFDSLDADSVSETADRFLQTVFEKEFKTKLINWAAQFDWDIAAKAYWNLYNKF